jgi:3-methyladenine DNA glycosylase AlkD
MAANMRALADEIDTMLRALPSPRTATVRSLRRQYSKRLAKWPATDVVALGLKLLDSPYWQHRFVGYELVCHHPLALASLRPKDLERFGRGLDSWGAVDCFACYLTGPAWRAGQVSERFIEHWARSPNRWRRRAALVSTVPLNNKTRGGSGDAIRTLKVCRLLLDDRDDMVVKAMSWALRELAKRDPQSVRAFLRETGDRLARRVLREVGNKLATGLKNPRR